MRAHDPKLALSATETETLRALRAKLGRPAASDAARAVVARTFFEMCSRVGLPTSEAAGELSPATIKNAAAAADFAGLSRLLGALRTISQRSAADWSAAVAAGAPQAVISRRLALAGREARLDVAEDA